MEPCCLHAYHSNLWSAAHFGDEQRVRHILEHDHKDPGVADEYGYTPLHLAAQAGHLSIVRRLLRAGAAVDAAGCGATPLHRAAYNGLTDVCAALLSAGASVTAVDTSADDLRTPLHKAASGGHAATVALLLAHRADPNARDRRGHKPWEAAAQEGWAEVARQLAALSNDGVQSDEVIAAISVAVKLERQRATARCSAAALPPPMVAAPEPPPPFGARCCSCGKHSLVIEPSAGCGCRVCGVCAAAARRRAPSQPRPCCDDAEELSSRGMPHEGQRAMINEF